MWQQAVGTGLQMFGGWMNAKSQQNAAKRAGTTLANRADQKAQQAIDQAAQYNTYISPAYESAKHKISTAYNQGADYVEQVAGQGATDVINRAERAGQDVLGAGREANTYLDPYRTAGAEAITSLSEMGKAKAPTAADLEMDPGYQFRLAEGMKALQRSAAARGGLLAGGTLRGITRYSQSEASQEYANAFDRFMKQQEARRQSLSQLANLGSTAALRTGENVINTNRYAGDYGTRGTEVGTGYRNRGAEIGTGYRTDAARSEAGLDIEQAQNMVNNLRYGDEVARGAWDENAQATANSIYGAGMSNPWGAAATAAGRGLQLWGATSTERGGGGVPGRVEGPDEGSGEGSYPRRRRWWQL